MKKALWIIAALIGGFLLLGLVAGNSPEAQERASARQAIDLCWTDQKRKSLSASQAQFIAGACEKMERDFQQRFGVSP